MKRLALVALLLFATITINSQSPIRAAWDYPTTSIPDITEFQVKVNDGAYMTIGLPTPVILSDTLVEHQSFTYTLPTVPNGQTHVFSVRACNATECSWDTTAVFKVVGPPKNARIIK